jgi:hypothetical protein
VCAEKWGELFEEILEMARDGTYDVVWPRGKRVASILPFAKRLDTLNGKTVCELWDYLFRGEEIFPLLERALQERYPRVKFVSWREFPSEGDHRFPDWEDHPNVLAEKGCDAVITGIGG